MQKTSFRFAFATVCSLLFRRQFRQRRGDLRIWNLCITAWQERGLYITKKWSYNNCKLVCCCQRSKPTNFYCLLNPVLSCLGLPVFSANRYDLIIFLSRTIAASVFLITFLMTSDSFVIDTLDSILDSLIILIVPKASPEGQEIKWLNSNVRMLSLKCSVRDHSRIIF